MQTAITSILAAIVAISSVSGADTVTFTNYKSGSSQTNQFNTNSGYLRGGSSLDGQPTNAPANQQWQTTDPYNPTNDRGSTSLVSFINNYTARTSGGGNNSVYFGGYNADSGILPGTTNPSLFYSFNTSMTPIYGYDTAVDLAASPVTYTVDFAIIGPSLNFSAGFPTNDFFGFSLLATNGASLAGFTFNPYIATLTNGLRVQWERNGTNVVADGVTFKNFEILYNSLYRMTAVAQGSSLSLSIAGLQTQSGGGGVGITNYAVVTNQNIISGGSLSGALTASDFQRASIDWELASGNSSDPGGNYMIINSVSLISQLSLIPEPGSWAGGVLLLGALATAVARRRRLAADDGSSGTAK